MRRAILVLAVGVWSCALPGVEEAVSHQTFASRFLSPIVFLEHKRSQATTTLQRREWQWELWTTGERLARDIVAAYWAGEWEPQYFDQWMRWCLEGPADRILTCSDLQHQLSEALVAESLNRLRQTEEGSIAELVRMVDQKYPETSLLLGPGGGQAGFHRGHRFIFVDLAKISPRDWFVIFIHEVIHQIDSQLWYAVHAYAILDDVMNAPLLPRSNDPTAERHFPFEQTRYRKVIRSWLVYGLERGLLAEWRAWIVTFRLYRDGCRRNLFPTSPTYERILANVADDQLASFTFALVDRGFSDPTDGAFASPLVRDTLRELRAELRRASPLKSLGNLAPLVPELP